MLKRQTRCNLLGISTMEKKIKMQYNGNGREEM